MQIVIKVSIFGTYKFPETVEHASKNSPTQFIDYSNEGPLSKDSLPNKTHKYRNN